MSRDKEIATIIYRSEWTGERTEHFIESANQAALDLFHTTRAAFVGRNILDFILDDGGYQQLAILREGIIEQKQEVNNLPILRYMFKRDDGSQFSADAVTMRRVLTMFIHPGEEEI